MNFRVLLLLLALCPFAQLGALYDSPDHGPSKAPITAPTFDFSRIPKSPTLRTVLDSRVDSINVKSQLILPIAYLSALTCHFLTSLDDYPYSSSTQMVSLAISKTLMLVAYEITPKLTPAETIHFKQKLIMKTFAALGLDLILGALTSDPQSELAGIWIVSQAMWLLNICLTLSLLC